MTEENRNEKETPETPEEPQASSGETAPEAAVPETSEGNQVHIAATLARGEDAGATFPGQVRAALAYAAANQYEYGPGLHDVELT